MGGFLADGPVDPELLRIWVEGWTRARETLPPVAVRGGYRVEVGWPDQLRRYVFAGLDAAVETLDRSAAMPWVHVKACVPREALAAALPPGWVMQDPHWMMVVEGRMAVDPVPLPARLSLLVEERPTVDVVRIVTETGDVAASGYVAFVEDQAIYDRIVTHEDWRRQGLGRAVMAALDRIAAERGIDRGILVATDDGRRLYELIGWRHHAPYAGALLPG